MQLLGTAKADGCQRGASLVSENIEFCYNTISNGGTAIEDAGAVILNLQFVDSAVGAHWLYRNTIYGGVQIRGAAAGSVGPFELDSNVSVVASGPVVYGFYAAIGTGVTQENTECHGLTSANIIDTTTLLLKDTAKASYLGKRGAEIIAP